VPALLLVTSVVQAAEPTLADLEQATRLSPSSAEAWDDYGVALARSGRYKEALDALDRALQREPGSRRILHHQAMAHAWSANYAEALRRYRALLDRYPQDAELRVDYGQVLAWDRQYAAARKQYQAVLAREPTHVDGLRHLAMLTAWEGRHDEALALLARAAALDPRNVDVLMAQGEILSWKGELAGAVAAFQRARDIVPENMAAWLHLAQVRLWQGRVRDAVESYRRTIELDPRNVDAYLGVARGHIEMREYGEAEKALRDAQVLAPADPRISRELAGLAAQRTPDVARIVEYVETLLFVAILAVFFLHLRRYRRVMSRHALAMRALFALLPLLAIASLTSLVFILFAGRYYREVQIAWSVLELLNLTIVTAVLFALVWLLRFEHPRRRQTVLAIGAHPDDIEFGCGATLLRYREEGCETHALVLTGGERGHNGPKVQIRVAEARAGARALALTALEIHDLPDTQLAQEREKVRTLIEEAVHRLQPDIVFTHNARDAHADHRAVYEATREAVRGACTILCYENPNTPPEFNPDLYVDVGDYLEDKVAALACHRSQAGKPYADPKVIRHSAGFRGNQARIRYAEAFEAIRILERAPGA
jgi:LmbE family N-acetylglucosaminyl deacetylase/cytochrome c-type biogenesis protein CcmH/NrfG